VANFPTPPFLSRFWLDAFDLQAHLRAFLKLDAAQLAERLQASQRELADLGRRDFDWEAASEFYRDRVGEVYLLELSAWHLRSRDYIGDTLRLVGDRARGRVLDFGGGIGTHTLGAALSPRVEQVVFCDLNPLHREFVAYRAQQLGLADKIACYETIADGELFDTILCFDLLEHLPDPSAQLRWFHQALTPNGNILLNWYFFKGFDQEFPFHLDDPVQVERFFFTLQYSFLEVFHPYHITARCYRKQHPREGQGLGAWLN